MDDLSVFDVAVVGSDASRHNIVNKSGVSYK